MTQIHTSSSGEDDVSGLLIQALFKHPHLVKQVLDDAQLAPHQVAIWARGAGEASQIEKLAGWLSVGEQLEHYKPLLEVAGSHLRAGDVLEALPVFRWAYRAWQQHTKSSRKYYADGVKLLSLWGECLLRLGQSQAARVRWLQALNLIGEKASFVQLARVIERNCVPQTYQMILEQGQRRGLPGATALWQRWQRIQKAATTAAVTVPEPAPTTTAAGSVVMADVANLDMVCREQFGFERRLDYGRMLDRAANQGALLAQRAFVPDLPATLNIRRHLRHAGFTLDLIHPKRSHGRIVANADTAMAAHAVRWAGEPRIGRIELWSGDGDFLRVHEVVRQTWPDVMVVFRSFAAGTAAGIRALGSSWIPITSHDLQIL